MKKILIVSSYCFEKATANGICSVSLRDALKKAGYDVHLLGMPHPGLPAQSHEENEHMVILPEQSKSKKGKMLSRIKSVLGSMKVPEEKSRIEAYKSKIFELDRKNKFDAIVGMFFPFENLSAAGLLKKKRRDIKYIIYELDSALDGVSKKANHGFAALAKKASDKAKRRWTKRQYEIADMVCIMKCHERHVKKYYYKQFGEKIRFVDLPLLTDKTLKNDVAVNETVNFLYTGELDRGYRTPAKLLEMFRKNIQETNWRIDFFSKGDCEEMLEECSRSDSRISRHGYVDSKTLDRSYAAADVLLSVGNAVSNCMPSKVINYVSCGKPIVHICLQKDDVCAEYLRKYPLAFISEFGEPVETAAERLNEFVRQSAKKRIRFDGILSVYPENSPTYSVNIIGEVL